MDLPVDIPVEIPDPKRTIKSFIGGIIFTVMLVIVIPVLTSEWIQPFIEKQVNSFPIAIVSSSLMFSASMLLITLLFSYLLGGGAILRNYGVIGVIGLIFAYWLLGNIYGAVIPVATLILVAILKWLWGKIKARREKKGKGTKDKKSKKSKKDKKSKKK